MRPQNRFIVLQSICSKFDQLFQFRWELLCDCVGITWELAVSLPAAMTVVVFASA